MGRMVEYELIADERVRRQTFRKRKAGLLKKLSELKTLCSVDACAIIYPTNTTGSVAQPDVWPSPSEANHLLQRFKNLPSPQQAANMMNQEKFLTQNILRVSKNFDKEKQKNRGFDIEQQMIKLLFEKNLHDFSNLDDLRDVASLLDAKINLVNDKIENLARDENGNEIRSGSRCGKEKQQSI
ncbi:hypothetical protein CsSME_00036270 [Camellia sinensis var. sinensis]